jgi:uncharacterized damage-inducible protein DinB
MTMKEINELFSFDEWATNRTLDSVSALTEEQFKRDLKSSHGGIQGTMVHICGADWIWLERWKGNSPAGLLSIEQVPTLDDLNNRWKSYREEIKKLLTTLDGARLEQHFAYKDTKGNQYAQPLFQQMLHKINHASYHRGQIVTMIRQLGAKPQNTDLIAYYRTIQQ